MATKKQKTVVTKKQIREVNDIIRTTETDENAVRFLRDTLGDSYTNIDIDTQNLHQAFNEYEKGLERKKKPALTQKALNIQEEIAKHLSDNSEKGKPASKTKRKKRKSTKRKTTKGKKVTK